MLKIYSCLAVLTKHQLERFIEPSVKRKEEGKSERKTSLKQNNNPTNKTDSFIQKSIPNREMCQKEWNKTLCCIVKKRDVQEISYREEG